MEEKLGNLNVSGAGSVSGGKYNEVKVSGAASIDGDIECNILKSSGASDIKGNVKAAVVEVSGASNIKGDLESQEITVSGASNIRGNVITGKIKISGSSDIKGNLHAEEVEIRGAANIKQNCDAENFNAKGAFEIGGLLNAGTVEIEIFGKCCVKEIGGEKINVRKSNNNIIGIVMSILSFKEKLITETIEGDEIYIENTNAKIVRGNNVVIGPNCEIETVEYRNTIKIDGDLKINTKKIE